MRSGEAAASTAVTGDAAARARAINERLGDVPLFTGARRPVHREQHTSWRLGPDPFWLPPELVQEVAALGDHLLAFYQALDELYHRSLAGDAPAWVATYLNQGKPDSVRQLGRAKAFEGQVPLVIRPDLLLTPDGFVASELDSVPGGIGFLGSLSGAYAAAGFDLMGGETGMVDAFETAVRQEVPEIQDPVVAIVVSDESADYRDEMIWLADALRERGMAVLTVHPRDITFRDGRLYFQGLPGEHEERSIDLVYRFFELFDLPNIPNADLILFAARQGNVRLTPPPKTWLEEKMSFAFFHHPVLEGFWRKSLGDACYRRLGEIFPHTWILDPRPLPGQAVIPGLRVAGEPVQDWRRLGDCSQSERQLVVKPSGFDETAWGSRGVVIGHDLPNRVWQGALQQALEAFPETPHVLQRFHKGRRVETCYYDFAERSARTLHGRVRLTPYYFAVDGGTRLGGALATICPLDKKTIHGMVDAVMVPTAPQPADH